MTQLEITNLLYLISAIGFIVGIKRLSHPKTARSGNFLASLGMLVAIVATLSSGNVLIGGEGVKFGWELIALGIGIGTIIGLLFASRVEMTQMPQMVAIFNGLGGSASALVASAEFISGSDGSYIIMCCRFVILSNEAFGLKYETSYNVVPSQLVPVRTKDNAKLMKWSYSPSWKKDMNLINCRSETMNKKTIF